jgi:hypothetical protein
MRKVNPIQDRFGVKTRNGIIHIRYQGWRVGVRSRKTAVNIKLL